MSEQELAEQKVEVVDTTAKEETVINIQKAIGPSTELNMSEVKDPEVKDPTQVKTLQQMAVEQGAKIPKQMTPEQLRTQLLLDHHMGMSAVIPAFKSLSQRGKDRIFTAIMQLPHEGIETSLNGNFEKQIYLAAQKAQMAKHAILFNRAKQEKIFEDAAIAQKEKAKKEKEEAKKAAGEEEKSVETPPVIVDTNKVEATPVQSESSVEVKS